MNLPESTPQTAAARVLVVDDHPLMRRGVAEFLTQSGAVTVCGEADSLAAAQAFIENDAPDLMLMDLHLGQGDPLELIKTVRSRFPSVIILVLSQYDETVYAERVLRAGASGYIMKQEATEEVLSAIKAVLHGDMYVSRRLAMRLFKQSVAAPEARTDRVTNLTDRELHIFELIGANHRTRDIAQQLGLSVKTVETHRENIKRKLEIRDAQRLLEAAQAWVKKSGPAI